MALSPTSSRGSGGGSIPTARGQYTGNAVTIGSNANGFLTLNTKASGDALLDISTPDTPAIVTAGHYAIACQVGTSALTAAGSYKFTLEVDSADDTLVFFVNSPPSIALVPAPAVVLTLPAWYYSAGAQLSLNIKNQDGAHGNDFNVTAFAIQKLS